MFAAMKVAHPTFSEWVQIGVAGGTGLLAVFTAIMAWKTRDMAKATVAVAQNTKAEAEAVEREAQAVLEQSRAVSSQVEITRAAFQASIQPWLAPLPGHRLVQISDFGAWFQVSVKLTNVGTGLAIIPKMTRRENTNDFGCRIIGSEYANYGQGVQQRRTGFADASVVAVKERTEIQFKVENAGTLEEFSGQKLRGISGEFTIEIDYTDGQGEQLVTAQFRIARGPQSDRWMIYEIDYSRDGDTEPFASVRSAPPGSALGQISVNPPPNPPTTE